MPATSTAEDEQKIAAEFTQMYNKWFRELVSIEDNILKKAEQVQVLQNSLDTEADTLKNLNDHLVEIQIEQNCMEDLLNIFAREQEELQREISKLEESVDEPSGADTENFEECSVLFETLDVQLQNVKEKVKNLVEKINNKEISVDKENPFPMYRTILDHYADALRLLNSNTIEMQQKFGKLQQKCVQNYIPSDIFKSPPKL